MAAVAPTTFIMARHGKTSFNAEGRICGGGSDPALTEEGHKEAEKLGKFLEKNYTDLFETVYCSTLQRSSMTAQIAFKQFPNGNFTIVPVEDLREIDHGKSEGMKSVIRAKLWNEYVESYKQQNPESKADPFLKWTITPFQDAETFDALINRVSEAMIAIAKQFPNRKIVIVAHNAVMQGLMMRSLHLQTRLEIRSDGFYPMFFEVSLIPNCNVAVFECNPSLQPNEDRIKYIKTVETV